MRNILLLEPNYKNKYPPIGLMKIATYHRKLGDNVTFFKGNLKDFVVGLIAKKCVEKLHKIDATIDWCAYSDKIKEYLKNGKSIDYYNFPLSQSKYQILLIEALKEQKKYFQSKGYEKEPLFDRVYVATLFTFYWKITIETINFAKKLVKDISEVKVGGVAATLLYDDIVEETGIKPIKGLLDKPKMLDKNSSIIIDALPLDYSILDEIDYHYPENNAYYGYMTRGCKRKCPFCAVPILEPHFCDYVPIKQKIDKTKSKFGEKRNLLLLDNNVLASPRFSDIIQEIIDCGFGKGATYTETNQYEVAVKNLKKGINNPAYINKLFNLNTQLLDRLKGEKEQYLYDLLEENSLLKLSTTTADNLLTVAPEILQLYTKYIHRTACQRYVDFNQGVDARFLTNEKAKLLGKINIRPLRIAFDSIKDRKYYENAVRLTAKAGIKNFSNYLLYNYDDTPIDLYQRLKINVELCEELAINIYSFPMKFHPILGDDRFNRNYLGVHWNRKYIRAVQAILNSTKGKIGKGESFFYKAFGRTEDEFYELLEMPETFILYRYFFEWLDGKHEASTNNWRKCWKTTMKSLKDNEKEEILKTIHENAFTSKEQNHFDNPKMNKLLRFYTDYRKDIITPGTELYKLKQKYDKNPTIPLKRKKKT